MKSGVLLERCYNADADSGVFRQFQAIDLALAQPASQVQCNRYAQHAVTQYQRALEGNCDLSRVRMTGNYDLHYRTCLGWDANRVNSEEYARASENRMACERKVQRPPVAGFQPKVPPPAAMAAVGSGKNCPATGRYRSQNSKQPVKVVFFNGGTVPLDIYWIDFNGEWKKYHTLRPNSHVNQKTFATHPWVAVDGKGNCRGSVAMPNPRGGDEENNFQFW